MQVPKDQFIDLGSAPITTLNIKGTLPEDCQLQPTWGYSVLNSQTSRILPNYGPFCIWFPYFDPSNDTACLFEVSYGNDNDRVINSGYIMSDFANLPLSSIVGSKGSAEPLHAEVIFGNIAYADNCDVLPGIIGLDMGNSSLLSQLAAQGKINKAVSFCGGTTPYSFMILGNALPDIPLEDFPIYKGEDMKNMQDMDDDFSYSVQSMNLGALNDHFYTVVDEVRVNGEMVHSGDVRFSGFLDTGSTLMFVPQFLYDFIFDYVEKQVDKIPNALYRNSCFQFPKNMSIPDVTKQVIPQVSIKLAGGVVSELPLDEKSKLFTDASDYVYVVCIPVDVSPLGGPQITLGVPFFTNHFVQVRLYTVQNIPWLLHLYMCIFHVSIVPEFSFFSTYLFNIKLKLNVSNSSCFHAVGC